jgi:hypothetical protein
MATILDLPLELLDKISAGILPHSIVSFILTCKTIYVRSKPTIDRHNAYRKKWKNASHQGPLPNFALYFLYEISHDPLVPHYIERLDLWDKRTGEEVAHARAEIGEDWDIRNNETKMQAIEDLVADCGIFEEAGIDLGCWWDHIVSENKRFGSGDNFKHFDINAGLNTTIITLLLVLPELKQLGLPFFWDGLETAEEGESHWEAPLAMLTHLVKRARHRSTLGQKCLPPGYSPLHKLETILPYRTGGYEQRIGLQDIEHFLPLPNLRNVYSVSGMADLEVEFAYQPHNSTLEMSLRRLELGVCCCSAEGIQNILCRTPQLEVFKYRHDVKYHGCGYIWDPDSFFGTLVDCVGTTLKELAVLVLGITVPERSSSDFRAFQKLEDLEVDFSTIVQTIALVEVLPTTVRNVLLHITAGDFSQLQPGYLSGFNKGLSMGPQALEKFLVQINYPESNDQRTPGFRKIVEEQGAEYAETYDYGPEFEGVGWSREFSEKFDTSENGSHQFS